MTTRTASSRPRSARGLAAAAAALLLVVGLAACGDDGGDDAATGSDDGVTTTTAPADDGGSEGADYIEAKDFSLTSITVAPGAEVEVENEGQATHTVTSDDDAFDSGEVAAGATGSFTAPTEPGAYPFHCSIHASMTGTLTVEG
jgi:plastocyanin